MIRETGFRGPGFVALPEAVRERFWEALGSGLSPTAAATVAGVCGATGRKWARHAGCQTNPRDFGLRYPQAARDAFWLAVRSGFSPTQAAAMSGVSETAGRRWVREAGYVPRTQSVTDLQIVETTAVTGAALSFVERCRLEELLETGHRPGRAAQLLGRHRSTISREIERGQTASGYRARVGQDLAQVNRQRPKQRKLESRPALREQVVQRLEQRHSPEQIASRLREDFPDDPEMWVSHETIYQAMYVQPRGELAKLVKTALRTGRTQRKPQGRSPIGDRTRFKAGMIGISDRPAEADDRAVPGHWEGDLIMGAGNTTAIGTLVERSTGFVMLLHLPEDHTAATLAQAMTAKIPDVPEVLRRSLTWDQGAEMALHTAITEATGLPIYFCDPHSPWQRGTNENTNGLLRQYFPKGTDLSFYGPGWLDKVAAELNARPRKRLKWRTPAEELDRLLSDPSTFVAASA